MRLTPARPVFTNATSKKSQKNHGHKGDNEIRTSEIIATGEYMLDAHTKTHTALTISSKEALARVIRFGFRTAGSLRGSQSSRKCFLACSLSRIANTIVTAPTARTPVAHRLLHADRTDEMGSLRSSARCPGL